MYSSTAPPPPVIGIPVSTPFSPAPPPTATPPPAPSPRRPPGAWTTGLCDCCDDCHSCCLTCWCPCIAFGHVAEILDKGARSRAVSGVVYCILLPVSAGLCHWIYSCTYRSKLRAMYGLPETPCADCCVHCCCERCALCQMYRELNNRGLDPAIGWEMNTRRMMMMASPPQAVQGMLR